MISKKGLETKKNSSIISLGTKKFVLGNLGSWDWKKQTFRVERDAGRMLLRV
jgi:hypothetical protein